MKTFAVLFLLLVACSGPPHEKTCEPPVAFTGPSSTTIRHEQLSRPSTDVEVEVPLQPGDRGHRLQVFATTEQDFWQDGGSLTFLDSEGQTIYDADGLCVEEFASGNWVVPESAVSLRMTIPTDVFATVLFTVVIEPHDD